MTLFLDQSIVSTLTFAQDDQSVPGTSTGASSATGASTVSPGTGGSGTTTATPRQPGFFDSPMFLILMLMVVGLIVMSSMGQRRERKKREALINAIKKHDRVQTIGGVIGSVVEIKPDYVVLKVDESSNTRITFSRSAIAQVLTAAPESAGSGKE
jgi:preprotein translocase subunit YajC